MKGRFSRTVIMIAGILTVVIIILSQSFYQPSKNIAGHGKEKKEQKDKKHGQQVSIAPSEVVPSSAVQLDKNTPSSFLEIFTSGQAPEKSFDTVTGVLTSLVKVFLKATISPNAP